MKRFITVLAISSLCLITGLPSASAWDFTRDIALQITKIDVTGTKATVTYYLPNGCQWDHEIDVLVTKSRPAQVTIQPHGQVVASMDDVACTQVAREVQGTVDLGTDDFLRITDDSGKAWWTRPSTAAMKVTTKTSRTAVTVLMKYTAVPMPSSYVVTATNTLTGRKTRNTATGGRLTLAGLQPNVKYTLKVTAAFSSAGLGNVTLTKIVRTAR